MNHLSHIFAATVGFSPKSQTSIRDLLSMSACSFSSLGVQKALIQPFFLSTILHSLIAAWQSILDLVPPCLLMYATATMESMFRLVTSPASIVLCSVFLTASISFKLMCQSASFCSHCPWAYFPLASCPPHPTSPLASVCNSFVAMGSLSEVDVCGAVAKDAFHHLKSFLASSGNRRVLFPGNLLPLLRGISLCNPL